MMLKLIPDTNITYDLEQVLSGFEEALEKSACRKHSVVCIIKTRGDKYILGWNGPPEGKEHAECLRKGLASGERIELCTAIHAEVRAISNAKKMKEQVYGGILFMREWFPCAPCAKAIADAGVGYLALPKGIYSNPQKRILVPELQNSSYEFEKAEKILTDAKVRLLLDSDLQQ